MLFATLVFIPLALVLLVAELRLLQLAETSELQSWLAGHLYLPLLRATALLAFVFLAHPQLYGLDHAPALGTLLASDHYRFDQLINVLLLVSLLLPLLPFVQRIAGATLALQGICATALIATWIAHESAREISLMPDPGLVLRIVAVLVVARLVAELLAREFIRRGDIRELVVEAVRMAAQLPAIMIYARFLGSQLKT